MFEIHEIDFTAYLQIDTLCSNLEPGRYFRNIKKSDRFLENTVLLFSRLRIGQAFREHQKIGQVFGEHYNFQGLESGRHFGNTKNLTGIWKTL